MTKLIEQSIDKIESWLAKKGFALLKSKLPTIQDEVDFDRKVVFLSLRSKPECQLYSLLHECGHVVIRTRKDYGIRFAASVEREENPSKNETNRSIVEQIEEEILAWREGQALANKLDIYVNDSKYYKYGYRWVMSYVVLAAVGKEHYLPNSFIEKIEEHTEKQVTEIDMCKVLDNVHPVCYNGVISKPEQQDQ